jgi:hypothetical protein
MSPNDRLNYPIISASQTSPYKKFGGVWKSIVLINYHVVFALNRHSNMNSWIKIGRSNFRFRSRLKFGADRWGPQNSSLPHA